MKELLRRISYLWNRRRLEREMAEEMAYHRELMSPDRRTKFRQRPAPARRRARDLGLDLARSSASGSDIWRPRAPQCPRLHPHGDAGSGSGHRRPVERLSCGADRPSRRVGARPGFARASDAPRAWRSHDEPDVSRAGLLCRQREVVPKRHRRLGAQSGSLQRGRGRQHARVNPRVNQRRVCHRQLLPRIRHRSRARARADSRR